MTRDELFEACWKKRPVVFGRRHGEKTVGLVTKVNMTRCKIKLFESRGSRSKAGEQWNVGFNLVRLATEAEIKWVKNLQEAMDTEKSVVEAPGNSIVSKPLPSDEHPLFSFPNEAVRGKSKAVPVVSSDEMLALLG